MIVYDFITYLESDATLDTLLGVTAGDTKLFPEIIPQETTLPAILYSNSVGLVDETLDEVLLSFKIYASTKSVAGQIRERIKTLIDKQDGIQDIISPADYWLYYCKLTGGGSFVDADDTDNIVYIETMEFQIKYRNKV